MSRIREFLKKQPKEDKKIAAELLKTSTAMIKAGRHDLAIKYLLHNKKKYENKPKKSIWKRLLKIN